jgi:hypothetical protein
MMRRRQCLLLVPSLLRALPRTQLATGVTVAFGAVWLLSTDPDSARTIVAVQCAALALGLAVASILDDPAADTIASVPLTLLVRRILAIALVLPAVAAAWIGVVSLSGINVPLAGAMTLQLGGLVLLTLAFAAVNPIAFGGAVAGPLVVLVFFGGRVVAPDWAFSPELGDWRWDVAWAGLATCALLALLLASRDPAHRPRVRPASAR